MKAINQTTQGVVYFNSMYAVQQRLSINTVLLRWSVEGINNCKTGISKKDAHQYKFEYIQKEAAELMIIKNQPISAQEAWLISIIYRFSHG